MGGKIIFFGISSQDILDDPPFMVLFPAASFERRLFLSKNIHEWREKISPPPPPVQATIPLVLAVGREGRYNLAPSRKQYYFPALPPPPPPPPFNGFAAS